MDLFTLTRALIDIPSTTGEEAEVARFLQPYLQGLGYDVDFQLVEGERGNLIATTKAPPRIVFSTHLDTVPPHIPSSENGETIFGRGACDAKGIVAAEIHAAEKLRAQGVEEIGLLFTVDEEMGSVGAAVANQHKKAPECRFLINGEPTDNYLAVGTKGSLRLKLVAQGRSAHSAYPEHGESAIEKLLLVLADIRECDWPRDPFFGETTCNIGTIQGGTRPNVIPEYAEAVLQIRLITEASRIKSMLEEAVNGRAQIEYLSVHNPVRLVSVNGFPETVVRFTTDIPYLSNWGKQLLLGPGSILDAHTANERIAKVELGRAVDLYVKLANTLLGS